jgi:hypothetical protein
LSASAMSVTQRVMMIGWRNCFRRQGTWRRIFLRSAVNGATYRGEQLPRRYWDWPKNTYLQRRLKYLKQHSYPESAANCLKKPTWSR